jgi:hypothetical protein
MDLEHRVVMERLLGRKLLSTEHVHHINGDKLDNRPENLTVLSEAEHHRHHARRPTECPRGHRYDAGNTYRRPNGYRYCRTCHREQERTRKKRAGS